MLLHTAKKALRGILCAEYIDFLSLVTPEAQTEYLEQLRRFNMGPAGEADCPVFDGMFEYFQVSCTPWANH